MMLPPWFPRMVAAELRKIISRGVGQLGLGIAALVAVAPVLVLYMIRDAQGDVTVNQNPMSQMLAFEVMTGLSWSLKARNFFVMPLILLTVTAQLLAGEWSDRTLRTLVLRPVPRWSVLGAKFSAALIYAGFTLLITYGTALALSLSLFTRELDIVPVSLAFAATLITDAGLICLGLLMSTIIRSVAGVIVGTILLLMGDFAIRMGLKAASMFGQTWSAQVEALMPGTGLSAWEGFSTGWDPLAFAGLGVLIAVAGGLALVRFERADVP